MRPSLEYLYNFYNETFCNIEKEPCWIQESKQGFDQKSFDQIDLFVSTKKKYTGTFLQLSEKKMAINAEKGITPKIIMNINAKFDVNNHNYFQHVSNFFGVNSFLYSPAGLG